MTKTEPTRIPQTKEGKPEIHTGIEKKIKSDEIKLKKLKPIHMKSGW